MGKVFIAGPLKIRTLDKNIKERLDNIIRNEIEVLVGDATGIDTAVQEYLNLLEQGKKTRPYLKPVQKFYSIIKLKDFEGLLNDCDREDLEKIDKKIRLYERINILSQGSLFDIQRKYYDKTKEDNLLLALEKDQYEVDGE